jgi:hypothetical protein
LRGERGVELRRSKQSQQHQDFDHGQK